jgi:hypothetical protein
MTQNRKNTTFFSRHYLHNRSSSDASMFGYIDVKNQQTFSWIMAISFWNTLYSGGWMNECMNVENWYYDYDRETSVLGENLSNSHVKESYPCTGLGRPLGFH